MSRSGLALELTTTDLLSLVAAPGVDFTPSRFAVVDGDASPTSPHVSKFEYKPGLQAGTLTSDTVALFLDNAIEQLDQAIGDIAVHGSAAICVMAGVAHSMALLQSVSLLVKDSRSIEALILASQLFEWSERLDLLATSESRDLSAQALLNQTDAAHMAIVAAAVEHGVPLPGASTRPAAQGPSVDDPDAIGADVMMLVKRAYDRGDHRLVWLWRANRLTAGSFHAGFSRLAGPDVLMFDTRESDVAELAEVGAFAVAAACRAASALATTLGHDVTAIESIRQGADVVFRAVDDHRRAAWTRLTTAGGEPSYS